MPQIKNLENGEAANLYVRNDLIRDEQIINKLYEHVKLKMKSNHIDHELFMSENNFHKNTEIDYQKYPIIDQLIINKIIQEVHDDLQIGFMTPESHIDMLKAYNISQSEATNKSIEPTKQEKYFLLPQENKNFYSKDYIPKSIYILYSIYLQR